MATREITLEWNKGDVSQYFEQCLKLISAKPICCKFVLEYPEGVQLPDSKSLTNYEEDSSKSSLPQDHNTERGLSQISPTEENLRFAQ